MHTPRLPPKPMLADTRRPHLCPVCHSYAYGPGHGDYKLRITIGVRVHHPHCPIIKEKR